MSVTERSHRQRRTKKEEGKCDNRRPVPECARFRRWLNRNAPLSRYLCREAVPTRPDDPPLTHPSTTAHEQADPSRQLHQTRTSGDPLPNLCRQPGRSHRRFAKKLYAGKPVGSAAIGNKVGMLHRRILDYLHQAKDTGKVSLVISGDGGVIRGWVPGHVVVTQTIAEQNAHKAASAVRTLAARVDFDEKRSWRIVMHSPFRPYWYRDD